MSLPPVSATCPSLELDDFGRIRGLEIFGREDVLAELRVHAR